MTKSNTSGRDAVVVVRLMYVHLDLTFINLEILKLKVSFGK